MRDEERVVLELDGLDAHALVVVGRDGEPGLLQLRDELRVHLVPVPVALLNGLGAAVHAAQLAPLGAGLEVRRARAEPHRAAHFSRRVSTV